MFINYIYMYIYNNKKTPCMGYKQKTPSNWTGLILWTGLISLTRLRFLRFAPFVFFRVGLSLFWWLFS